MVNRRQIALVAVAAMAGLLLAGCPGNGSSTPPAGPTGTPVPVTEKEYSITVGVNPLPEGTYTFNITNQGAMAHNLNVKGPGVNGEVSATIPPGGTGVLTVTLKKGSYQLWCSIDSHQADGMQTTLEVT